MSSIPANSLMPNFLGSPLLQDVDVATSDKTDFFQTFSLVTQPSYFPSSSQGSLPPTPTHSPDNEVENNALRSGSLSPARSSSVSSEPMSPEPVVRTASKAGRKRKSEVVDKDARAKERVIRNRAAAQESRDRKRRYISELEESNNTLKEQNDNLSMRLKRVEDEKSNLAKKLEALTAQLAQFQSQLNANPMLQQQPVMSNFLVGGFGESAVLTKSLLDRVSRPSSTDSQQRRLPTFKRNLYGPSSRSMEIPVCLNSYNISLVLWILIWIFSFGLNPNLLSLLPKHHGFRKNTDEDITVQPLELLSKVQDSVKILRQDWVFAPSLRNSMLWPP
ncbi:hypothetical protein K493DRAFT_312584 [Basidiobolus meristosporus CBS 931.73]|uniref:BZIP domain-containing protein n=1 Tax=Basidiobolus meristosporus CBS 931.73 TaxID=1314790 RepID=A0A1Y1YST0_9FUNG|nr:hypothetical protein K493DRAFT_312584 [Basidiobolus meristosporus CBS 931.73]|eukprot:ORY01093.1 hypothetical protein K493DRAFT_312584 [Basidiobolus meristosporus CBS 931.73]